MNFLTILAIIFGGRIVLIGADFWVEFRARAPSTSRGRSAMANFLYECRGDPPGTRAFVARESRCSQVTDRTQKVQIYMTCNFYSVYRPDLPNQEITYANHRRMLPEVIWYVGYKNDAIDHPNFAPALDGDLLDFKAKMEQMSFIVPQDCVILLAEYLALTNVIVFAAMPAYPNVHLQAYATVLHKITNSYNTVNQQRNAQAAQLKEQLGAAMKVFLEKMIDPCTIVQGNYQMATAFQYCAIYCSFLDVAARHFGALLARCTSLQGGQCKGLVCTCSQVVSTPLAGCQGTSPMQLCNNEMRSKLNLFFP